MKSSLVKLNHVSTFLGEGQIEGKHKKALEKEKQLHF